MITSRRFRCSQTEHGPLEAVEHLDDGYALIAVLVAVFLVLLALSVAAPAVARALRRDRELEAVHRADQYVRAIRLYYRKFGHYPGSLDQLEKSNNIRFLRQRYPDPFTGKADWRLIKVGTNKTTVKGFFGQPLAGVASAGLGTAAGLSSGIGTGTGPAGSTSSVLGGSTTPGITASGTDASTASAASGSTMGSSAGTTDPTSGASGFGSATPSGPGSTSGSAGGISSQSATSFSGTGAPFLGVGLPTPGNSILAVNEKTTYPDWEFLYDPRIEQLRSKVNLLGGGIGATGTSTLGSASGFSSTPTSSSPNGPTSTTTPSSNSSTPAGSSPAPQ